MPTIAVSLLGVALSVLALSFMLERQNQQINAHTLAEAYEFKDAIVREYMWSENVLRGIEGFFHSSSNVTRDEYRTFCASSIHKEIPLHLVEWQPKVTSSERASYERQAKRDGIKNFQFFEIDEKGNQVPAKQRDYHFPVFYSYSPEPTNQAVGLDLAFSPIRMRSKYRAMKIGEPVLSGTFDVIVKDSKKRNPGFAITHAVFNDPSISSSQSLNHLKGFVAIVLYLNEFFAPISMEQRLSSFQFLVKDLGDSGKTIYSTLKEGVFVPDFANSITFEVGKRSWELIVYPTYSFVKGGNGSLPWVVFSLILVLSFGLALYLFIKGKNLEKINRYERQLQQKQRLESLGILASGIAHEFNNILHCITLANENLKFSRQEELKEENINVSLEYCQRGQGLVRQILSFARKDTGSYKEVLPSQEIKNVHKLLAPSISKDVLFVLNVDEQNDKPVLMNSNHMSQILINLVNNAVHALEGKTGRKYIEVTYSISNEERVLTVKDNGEGMTEEVVQKIFDPFFSTKAVNEGTGLGLSVIYGIVKSYNGGIEVESEKGKGSVFTIRFPLEL